MSHSGFSWRFELPSWELIYELLLNLSQKILDARFKPDVIVGIARGGWPVTRILSDLLDSPEVATVKVESHSGIARTREKPVMTERVAVPVKNERILVVDDVADTGKSLELVRDHLEKQGAAEVKTATLYYKPWSSVRPDWFGRETRRWLVFPWELKETVRLVLNKAKEEGMAIEKAKEMLTRHGYNIRLLERFLKEIAEEQT